MELLIYSPQTSSRLDYTLTIFFKYIVQLPYRITQDRSHFQAYQGPCINYSLEGHLNIQEIWIPANPFIFEHDIHPQDLSVVQQDDLIGCFLNDLSTAHYPFDLFASSFYLLSLYENYLPGPRDEHGRFTASQSLAYKHNFLQRPLVDEYCLHLVQQLLNQYPDFQVQFPTYTFTPTYDIDVSWAYGHRPFFRQLGGVLRDVWTLNINNIRQRIAVQTQQKEDPFYTFPYLDELHQRYQLQPIYFFLLGDYRGLDRSISIQQAAQQQLVYSLAQKYDSGIHPSIYSNQSNTVLRKELDRYQRLTGQLAQRSRQHYLVLQFPQTYRRLLQQDLQQDYSLGYAQQIGFRASIARPFPWYDLQEENMTNLVLHPFACMDVTLKRSTQNQSDQIYDQIKTLVTRTKAVNGHLYTLWHNSSFSEIENWQGWKAYYEYLIEQALP